MSDSAKQVLQQLLNEVSTIQISSITREGLPNISYAPFVRDEQGAYYIFISQLASHTEDLLQQPFVAIMLSEDEQGTKQIFARTRVSYHCRVEVLPSTNQEYESKLDEFTEKFGNVITVLRGLSDFILFRLIPEKGRFVMGFGQAYELEGDDFQSLRHIE